jgi:hypothetical protein
MLMREEERRTRARGHRQTYIKYKRELSYPLLMIYVFTKYPKPIAKKPEDEID